MSMYPPFLVFVSLEELLELLTLEVGLVVGVLLDGVLIVDRVVLRREKLLEREHCRLTDAGSVRVRLGSFVAGAFRRRRRFAAAPQRTVGPSSIVVPAVVPVSRIVVSEWGSE